MSVQPPMDPEQIKGIAARVRKLSPFNSTSASEMALYFQTLLSAKESRIFIEAPGLYFPALPLLVFSKSGSNRGHATIYHSLTPFIPEGRRCCYAFVLYPGSFIRSCFDRVLRRTAKVIAKDLRLSMENVFNRKYHCQSLIDSDVEQEIIALMRREL